MNHTHRVSYVTILALIFLLPIFFIPAYFAPLVVSKALLVTIGSLIALGALLVDSFRDEGIALPKHYIMWGALALPLVYFASGIISDSPNLSLFGYSIEAGTAASILLFSVLFFATAVVFRDRSRLISGYSALFVSMAVLSLFALAKLFLGGDVLVLKNFAGNMGNPVGAWTDYAMIFGLIAILSVFASEMLPLRGVTKGLVYALFAVSAFMLTVTNFSTAWILILAASVILIVYFVTVEKSANRTRPGIVTASILAALALIFIVNPTVSSTRGSLSNAVAGAFGISNTDVRPALNATLEVSGKALRENPVLGSGPNTFSENWLKYKSMDINNTPFWSVAFPFGVGFVPTQISSTGLLGTLVWVIFFVLYIILGFKALARSPMEKPDRFLVVSSFLASLFLWIGAFVYMPSLAMLSITFIFTGFFVASAAVTGVVGDKVLGFSKSVFSHFVAVLVMLILAAGILAFALASYQKLFSAGHFQRALAISNTEGTSLDEIESELAKAVNLSPADPFWRALSELELARANQVLNSTTGTQEENSAAFQEALANGIAYMQNAITSNPNYSNWMALGEIYASLVPEPFQVEGAYESALSAYSSAEGFNPLSPEISLRRARLEIANGNTDDARVQISEALRRKTDYADAYFLLSQIEVGENNLDEAIRSAETGALLLPNNAGVFLQLGLLKYSNRDYTGAADAFRRSLAILPDYANAKYYLGLTLDNLGRGEEAIALFEDLEETNPDNELVKQVLQNLRAGKPAMDEIPDSAPIRE